MNYNLPGFFVHGILQARILPGGNILPASGLPVPSPGDHPKPGIQPWSLHCRQILYHLNHQGKFNLLLLIKLIIYVFLLGCPFS